MYVCYVYMWKGDQIQELKNFFKGGTCFKQAIDKIMKANLIQLLNTHFKVILYNEFVRNRIK